MWSPKSTLLPLLCLSALPAGVLGGDILGTTGFSYCSSNPKVKVTALNVQFNRNTGVLVFDVAGESTVSEKVSAEMIVSAYGKQIYTKTFDPCSLGMTEMCPIPEGTFSSSGEFPIPSQYASEIPAIAYTVPDLDGNVKLQLTNQDGEDVACIQSSVGNGHTLNMPVIAWVAAGIAVAALALSGLSALSAGNHPGASTASPTFTECIFWFQGIATNGMLSVNYPQVYQSFTTNFAFSTGLIPWAGLQNSIDGFRKATGGNLTDDSYSYLKNNATLVFTPQSSSSSTSKFRRALDTAVLLTRQSGTASVDGHSESIGGGASNTTSGSSSKQNHFVSGITAYVEQLPVAKGNTFMTVLVVFAIVVAAIIVGILLFKVILECWSMCGKLPKSLESWRRRYWWRMAKAIVNLILILYGMWTLICIYQFTDGDGAWGPMVLAGVTWGLFTVVLVGFTWRIWVKARQFKKLEGDASGLYEDKETWVKYSLFYDNFQKRYWMFFVPLIIYMFARGCVIAGANGHGMIQVAGQLIIEAIMLILLLWTRPYQRKSGKWINIVIHVVRVISVACILIFVEELGFGQTTQTITGVVLIVVQSVLTAVLAILIAVNALITCIKENPHRRARKEAEKANLNRDLDNLTPLDARNSLLMEPMAQHDTEYKGGVVSAVPTLPVFGDGKGRYDPVEQQRRTESPSGIPRYSRFDEHENLVGSAARMGMRDRSMSQRSVSPPRQQPRLPDLDFGYVNRR